MQNFPPNFLDPVIRSLDAIEPGLWDHYERVPELNLFQGKRVIQVFLELACQTQHVGNMLIGQHGIASLPRAWLLENIENAANDCLNLKDEWEYRRLLEVYKGLDNKLLQRLVSQGIQSPNPEVVEAAQEFRS